MHSIIYQSLDAVNANNRGEASSSTAKNTIKLREYTQWH